MNSTEKFPAYVVRQVCQASTADALAAAGQVLWLEEQDLPPGEVVIAVDSSSLNYKDALACQGNPGVAGKLPHVPGIDCAGAVSTSTTQDWAAGDQVLVTGYDLGSGTWGGYSGQVRVPAGWVVRMPDGMTGRQAMTYGTAGFTAAQCVMALLRNGARPDLGPLLVTGASGGVGVFAVAILAKLGFEVVAMSGKPEMGNHLRDLGAERVIGRDGLAESARPLLKADWAGGVDTVGGRTLAAFLRSTSHRGCVAACGLVAGAELSLTVYPFILRGVTLAGIDSAKCPHDSRLEVWQKLAGPWSVELPPELLTTINLDEVPNRVAAMLSGKTRGRTLVTPTTQKPA